MSADHHQVDVIILGAGVAGLAAAAELQAQQPGLRVAMIEARSYVGGRVVAAPLPGCPNDDSRDSAERSHENVLWTDAGAAWVHGTEGNPVMQWVSEADVVPVCPRNPWMSPSSAHAQLFHIDNCEKVDALTREEQDAAVAITEAVMRSVDVEAQALALGESDAHPPQEEVPASVGFRRALDRCVSAATGPRVRAGLSWWIWMIECWMGAGLGELQLAEFVASDLWGDFPGPHCVLHASPERPIPSRELPFPCAPLEAVLGYSGGAHLVRSLANSCDAARVWTSCTVTAVSAPGGEESRWERFDPSEAAKARGMWRVRGQRVVATGGGDFCVGSSAAYHSWVGPSTAGGADDGRECMMEWRAPVVVSTLPLGVLQQESVRFSPSLPPSVQRSVRQLRMGQYKKVVLRFTSRWWPASSSPIWGVVNDSDTHFQHIHEAEAAAEESRQGGSALTASDLVPLRVRYIENYEQMKGPEWAGVVGVVFVGPEVVRLAATVSKSELVDLCVRAMQDVAMGLSSHQLRPTPEPLASVAITEWEQDPWSGGAYSYFPCACPPFSDRLPSNCSLSLESLRPLPCMHVVQVALRMMRTTCWASRGPASGTRERTASQRDSSWQAKRLTGNTWAPCMLLSTLAFERRRRLVHGGLCTRPRD